MVLAHRPTPLADLVQSDMERIRGDQSRVEHERLVEPKHPLPDVGIPPQSPTTVD